MSDLLGIAAAGARAYRTALEVTGDNVANAQTTGYVRRSADLRVGAAGSRMQPLSQDLATASGVDVAAIRRNYDRFLASDARAAESGLARHRAEAAWLTRAEPSLRLDEGGAGAAIQRLFAAASEVAATPASGAARAAFVAAGETLATRLRETLTGLADVRADAAASLKDDSARLTGLAGEIAALNDGLRQSLPGTVENAALADRRDALLGQMAAIAAVETIETARGVVSVRLTGDGTQLVTGSAVVTVGWDDPNIIGDPYGTPFTLRAVGGRIGGTQAALGRLDEQIAAVRTLATDLASALNAAHATGVDGSNQPGAPLLSADGTDWLVTDPNRVATRLPTEASGGNGGVLALLATRGTFEARYDALAARAGARLAESRDLGKAAEVLADEARLAKDAASGVDLDIEAANLLRFQQAYQACARVIAAARAIVDTMLEIR
jgi:flagellar hook-associated protein 1